MTRKDDNSNIQFSPHDFQQHLKQLAENKPEINELVFVVRTVLAARDERGGQ